ncbi:hypothetical protein pEaSNUABM6_00213 [Erwinia phage pEa_SNUABM_6]|nr:hypothetical protein pEaSNUABM6_00213 [Erwinia phage pEa_SNUABM_6]
MFARYQRWGHNDPYAYFMLNSLVVCFFIYLYGIYVLDQDPAGAFLFVFIGMWAICCSIMAILYRLTMVEHWIDRSGYTLEELAWLKRLAANEVRGLYKTADWEDLRRAAKAVHRELPNLDFDYVLMAVVWAQSDRNKPVKVCEEATDFAAFNPKIWHIINYV